ncbi:unnamed protein product [Leptosia nina]|uniref:DNA-binding protein BIN4 n=1 Tax=Leptosia nina TaxID=320188 RepID=A0AAV1JVU3_9NEOP
MSSNDDDSFVWGSASDDSKSMSDNENMKRESPVKMEVDELDTEQSFSKKDLDKSKKSKKKKNNKDIKCLDNFVKEESESDSKHTIKTETKGILSPNKIDTYDESYLNLRIKEEESTIVENGKRKKNKKKRRSERETSDTDITIKSPKIDEMDVDSVNLSKEDKVKDNETSKMNAPINFESDENIRHHKPKKKKKRKASYSEDCSIAENSQNDITHSSDAEIKVLENGYASDKQSHNNTKHSNQSCNVTNISTTLHFEEDVSSIDLNHSTEYTESEKVNSKQIRKYLKNNPYLQPVSSKSKPDSIITNNDDIWLLKCPRDIDILNLKGVCVKMNDKTKLKIDGKAYLSTIESSLCQLSVMTFYNKTESVIKSIKANGCIVIKNKVPRLHIPENETMVNNQRNFIPLPETKCRHPLFGVNYKKSIKLPTDIVQRLHNDACYNEEDNVTPVTKKKKKHKKNKHQSQEQSLVEEIKTEEVLPSKKKKKRKHSESIDDTPVKAKRMKHNPEAPTWDSEKAIAETLFNF